MHDVFGAIGSARHHEEGGGDQGPQREADESFLGDRVPVGGGGEVLGIFGLSTRGSICCQFLCIPPQATHSHHRVSGFIRGRRSSRGSQVCAIPGHFGEVSSQSLRLREFSTDARKNWDFFGGKDYLG